MTPPSGGAGAPSDDASRFSPGAAALREDPNPGFVRWLLHLLYDLAWVVAALAALPWLLWKTWRKPGFGGMVLERLGRGLGDVPRARKGRPRVLIHGVSVGEIKGTRPIVRAIEERFPDLDVVVTSTTDTGMAVARELFAKNVVLRFPADVSLVLRRFLRRVEPSLVVLVELEIWPNFLRECNRCHTPVAVINGRITDWSHSRYLVFRRLMPQFNRISLFCVQSETYAERFRLLGVDPHRVLITGTPKADGLRTGRVEPGEELRRLLGPREGQLVLVAGSTHEPEELTIVQAWSAAVPDVHLILVPRHPVRSKAVVRDLQRVGWAPRRLSALRAGEETPDPAQPVIVDTIGELERVYGLADLVFVGGSLVEHGGHNMLEPAAQGRPVIFGPHNGNFIHESRLLLEAGAAREVRDAAELGDCLADLFSDPARRAAMTHAGLAMVERQKGAAQKTLRALSELSLDAMTGAGLDAAP